MEISQDAPSFDLVIELNDEDTQDEARAECGCVLERTEFSVGLLFCDLHRAAPEMREKLLALENR